MSARNYSSTAEAKTLQGSILAGATSMTLDSITTLPSNPNIRPYTLVIDPDTATEEIVTVTDNPSGSVLTITRGQDGTSAQPHNDAAVVKHMITARDLKEPQDHIYASAGVHGVTGPVVGTTDAQTLTNKTLTNPKINEAVNLTATSTELNILDGATLSTAELNILDGVTASTAEINILDGVTSSTAELNILDGVTASAAELNILDGVTASTAELNYVDGVTSAIQTQLDAKASTSDLSTHEADTTSIHGITDTSKLAKFGSSAAGRTIFVQTTTPTPVAIGDIWIDY